MKFLSKQNSAALYIHLGNAKVLTIWILPKTVKFLHLQKFKVFFNVSKFNSLLLRMAC